MFFFIVIIIIIIIILIIILLSDLLHQLIYSSTLHIIYLSQISNFRDKSYVQFLDVMYFVVVINITVIIVTENTAGERCTRSLSTLLMTSVHHFFSKT